MQYTAKFFRDNLPAWKSRKDCILTKIFYRPVSFYTASFCANHGISANSVSIFSTFVGILACSMFLFGRWECNIVGALLISLWLILDCTDGNLARCVKAQPFGEFVDAESSYTLVAFLGVCIGMSVFLHRGVLNYEGNPYFILAGALASSCDTLMRLIYQKYQNVARELSDKNIIPVQHEKRTDNENSGSLRVRLEQEPGIGGILPFLILLAAIFNALDLIIIYMVLYYCGGAILFITLYTFKAMRYRNLAMKL